ncbi:MAG: alpha/beta hydrolase [Mucilaginibacter polytrichastri]|nr:alpha/beta hydrolase [Mucilaginibacter polytrichastri]
MLCASMQLSAQENSPYDTLMMNFRNFYNAKNPDSLLTVFSSALVKREELDARKVSAMIGALQDELGNLNSFKLIRVEGITMIYKTGFAKGLRTTSIERDSLNRIESVNFEPYKEKVVALAPGLSEVSDSLRIKAGRLHGSLILPAKTAGKIKIPLIILLAGSGPTDRYGNNIYGVEAWSYRYLSNALAQKDIATLLFDKRMVGESMTGQKEGDLRFADYVEDATAWAKKYARDRRFSAIIFAGHSEGAIVGALAAQKTPVHGLITLEGTGRPVRDDMIKQFSGKDHPEYAKKVDSLSRGMHVHAAANDPLFRPSLQDYFIEILRLDPPAEMRKLDIPVLVVQGTTDLDIKAADAQALKNASKNGTLKMISGMNYVLKTAPADEEKNSATYRDPDLPVAPELVSAIKTFCDSIR